MGSIGNKEIMARNLTKYVELSGKQDKDIAEEIGVSKATFSEWKNGKKYPRIDKIERLALYFHIEKSDLIEEYPKTEYVPRTSEARIVSHGFDNMPMDVRERALAMFKIAFPIYFDDEGENDK